MKKLLPIPSSSEFASVVTQRDYPSQKSYRMQHQLSTDMLINNNSSPHLFEEHNTSEFSSEFKPFTKAL